MIRALAAFLVLAILAGCGVDGEPTPPEPRPEPGISVTGSIEIGVTGGS